MRGKRLAVKILVSLTVALWVGGVLFCIGYRLRHPVDSYSNPQNQQQERERVGITQQDNASPRREQADNQQSYAAKWFEPITLLTVFLVIGVAVTAYIYWRQLKEMQKTVAAVAGQGKTMQGQLDTMKVQAEAMREQVKLATKQVEGMIVGERAYLGIQTVSNPHLVIGEQIIIDAIIKNYGRTPAWKVKVPARVVIAPIGIWPNQPVKSTYAGEGVLGANDTRAARYAPDAVCNAELLEQIEAENWKLFIHFLISYEDSWGEAHALDQTLAWNPHLRRFIGYRQQDHEADQQKVKNPN